MSAVLIARRSTTRRVTKTVVIAILVAAVAAALVELPEVWATSRFRAAVKLTIWWGMAALLPVLLLLVARLPRLVRARRLGGTAAALFGICALAAALWARYVEPNQLRVNETSVSSVCGVRVALVSDIHRGVYGRDSHLAALVDKLNALPVDAVLVAGDWTYEPPRDLVAAFAPWSGLRHRSIGVLGNHDEQQPGPPLQRQLRAALQDHGLQWAEGRRITLGGCELVGLGDHDAGSDRRDLAAVLATPSRADGTRRIVITHNPDTMAVLPRGFAALTLAGHTHGGQINLPLLTRAVLASRTAAGVQRGLYDLPEGRAFVTSGTGMSKLPLRLFMPPTIDVLRL